MIKGREGKRGEGKEARKGEEGREGRGAKEGMGWGEPPENKSWLRSCMKLTTQFQFCIVAFFGFTKLTKKSDNKQWTNKNFKLLK
jgi:hypothetical protein